MREKTFPCGDCHQVFPDAKQFVDHTESCVPIKENGALLVEAIALLRRWRSFDRDALSGTLCAKTDNWLQQNNFQGVPANEKGKEGTHS